MQPILLTDLGLPPEEATTQQLHRVLLELQRLWESGARQRCALNLPLLADKLEACGLRDEARVARMNWSCESSPHSRLHLHLPRMHVPRGGSWWRLLMKWHHNQNRFFWFAPRTMDLAEVDWDPVARTVSEIAVFEELDIGSSNPRPDTDLHPGGFVGLLHDLEQDG